jgi:inorganic triphosphatase YgiF
MNHHIIAAFLISLSLGLPSYAASGVAPAGVTPATDHDVWVERIATAQEAMDRANQRYANAVQAYGHMRHRRRQRGERKAVILLEQENARAEVAEATHALEQTLEDARRAGVPPGWVREALAKSALPAERAH